jgi:hypothetical protein
LQLTISLITLLSYLNVCDGRIFIENSHLALTYREINMTAGITDSFFTHPTKTIIQPIVEESHSQNPAKDLLLDCWNNILNFIELINLNRLETVSSSFYTLVQNHRLYLLNTKQYKVNKLEMKKLQAQSFFKTMGPKVHYFKVSSLTELECSQWIQHGSALRSVDIQINRVRRKLEFTESKPFYLINYLNSKEIKSLKLENITQGSENIKLITKKFQHGLTELELKSVCIGDEGMATLAHSPLLAKLKYLTIEQGGFTLNGLKIFFGSDKLSTVISINLSRNRLTSNNLEPILNCVYLKALKHLNLSGNLIDDQGVQVLKEAKNMPSLEHLELALHSS